MRTDHATAVLLGSDALALLVLWLVAPWSHASSLALSAGIVTVFAAKSLYKSRLTLSVLDDLPVICATVLALVAIVALSSPIPSASTQVLIHVALALALILSGRLATYTAITSARRSRRTNHRTLIVGNGSTAALLGRMLDERPQHGLRVVGFLGRRADACPEVRDRLIGEDIRRLAQTASENDVHVVVLTLSGGENEEILEALRSRDSQAPFTLFVVPALQEMLHSSGADRVGHIALFRLHEPLLHVLPLRLKRIFDVMVAAVFVTLLAPVMALVAAAVRLEVGPGVLFRQTRVGQGGDPFVLYKFRSLRLSQTDSDQRWAAQNETRIGPVGRFIRETSLDELPQLFNILRGDMSLVGPRPERPHFVEQFGRTYDWYSFRHRVRPGLTGWAAVNGMRGDTSIQDRCLYDNAYIDNWSLWLDMKILASTVRAVFKGEGS
ncbi:MAG TPA: sugar transferase [Nocardioidaceae bacterium]|nr:sugar transferase [Nocardioidaceae bacterium]